MKLIIETQFHENYGAHDWDGKGECPQRWKAKGGDTFVVENLSERDVRRIQEGGIPTLTSLIEQSDDYYRTTIIDCQVVENGVALWATWETPTILSPEKGKWVGRQTVDNDGSYCDPISKRRVTYVLGKAGERIDQTVTYLMVGDTDWISYSEMEKRLG